MVALSTTMGWLSEMSDNLKRSRSSEPTHKTKPTNLEILAFEAAKTMSRILSLYKSLSDEEISKLRQDIIKSQGVVYLNSNDETFLLSLACAEKLEDLDKSAAAVARFGKKCSNFGLNQFELIYSDLKLGTVDFGKLEYGSKVTEKRVRKMERMIAATSGLYSSLESLTELEMSERKLNMWKKNILPAQMKTVNFDAFDEKITYQRKQVRHFRGISLWSETFDKSVGLMARIVCAVYTRICSVFGPFIPGSPTASTLANYKQREMTQICYESIMEQVSRSGPIMSNVKPSLIRFYSQKSICGEADWGAEKNNHVFHAAGPSTVGGLGLAVRYANVILLAEQYLDSAVEIDKDAREDLYEMLPDNLKAAVRSKLSKQVRCMERGEDEPLAEGWREALVGILGWLAPMAQDTLTWQMERNLEKTKFDSKPMVLLLQTLHFADKEKTEVAIVEVLVALSCIYRCRLSQ